MFNFIKKWFNKNQEKGLPSAEVHQLSSTVHYTINLPGHLPRTESDVFRATKKYLIEELNMPCWVCGSKENREIHHFNCEIAMINGVDWAKAKKVYSDFPDWDKVNPDDPTTFKYFAESVYSCRVLCMQHHRQSAGIHVLPWPIFNFQLIKKDDFEFFPESKGLFDFPVDDLS